MEIKSPIGELPFEIEDVQIGLHGVDVHGAMGAWPTEVSIPWADIPSLVSRTVRPTAPYLVAITAMSFAVRAAVRRHR